MVPEYARRAGVCIAYQEDHRLVQRLAAVTDGQDSCRKRRQIGDSGDDQKQDNDNEKE
ncbi:MAG: hypothetical protein U5L09_21040 [Bacteroidales bacterium]|nr:hypothetical protein [Bacteroidales bacterium]